MAAIFQFKKGVSPENIAENMAKAAELLKEDNFAYKVYLQSIVIVIISELSKNKIRISKMEQDYTNMRLSKA